MAHTSATAAAKRDLSAASGHAASGVDAIVWCKHALTCGYVIAGNAAKALAGDP